MNGIVGILVALLIAAVVLWLVSLFAPLWIAAIAALLIFLALVFGHSRVL